MKQLLQPEGEEDKISLSLIQAALTGDEESVTKALERELVDVNYRGPVNLRVKYAELIQRGEVADEIATEYQVFKTDVTPLFAAAHVGHVAITKKLLAAGAQVNEQVFKGYATTAAAREGHHEVLGLLLRAGAGQAAVEEALLEASMFGQAKAVDLLISTDFPRLEVMAQALMHACGRGFLDIVASLINSGVDINSQRRVLLRSARPMLHANVDCTPLFAAIVGRQTLVVDQLLKAGANLGQKASLGAWSWDARSEEELRVGAGLGEPYNEAWCAVEYWESSGRVLRMLLKHLSADVEQNGRSLLCHAILCRNASAMQVVLEAGGNAEFLMQGKDGKERPLHYATRVGYLPGLKVLLAHGCSLDPVTEFRESALILCAKYNFWDCFEELLSAGADLGLVNNSGESAISLAEAQGKAEAVRKLIWDALSKGRRNIWSSDATVFSTLHFAAEMGDVNVLRMLVEQTGFGIDVNARDRFGYTAIMVAAREGHLEAFKLLLYSGADISLKTSKGETAITLAKAGSLESLEWILLEAIFADAVHIGERFQVLHFAARRGHLGVLSQILSRGCRINEWNEDGYTALMLSAREGHAEACKLLLAAGADSKLVNSRNETALSLASKNTNCKAALGVILDHQASQFVIVGGQVLKHTRQGSGKEHPKVLCVNKSGLLSWGASRRRNVMVKEVVLGSSLRFQRNREPKEDVNSPGLFRILTTKGREFHFDASAAEIAELWVRGIHIVSSSLKDKINSSSGGAAGGLFQQFYPGFCCSGFDHRVSTDGPAYEPPTWNKPMLANVAIQERERAQLLR